MIKRVEIVAQDIPQNIVSALVADAAERNISINEAAVSTLADFWGVERIPSTRPHRGGGRSTQLLLAVPEELRTAIRLYVARTGATIRGSVIAVLAEHYGIESPDAKRRPRTTV